MNELIMSFVVCLNLFVFYMFSVELKIFQTDLKNISKKRKKKKENDKQKKIR